MKGHPNIDPRRENDVPLKAEKEEKYEKYLALAKVFIRHHELSDGKKKTQNKPKKRKPQQTHTQNNPEAFASTKVYFQQVKNSVEVK